MDKKQLEKMVELQKATIKAHEATIRALSQILKDNNIDIASLIKI